MSDSNGDFLSQEEIDALMSKQQEGDEKNQVLTDEEIDVLGEVGNIAMGSAATALYTILDQKVEITAPKVSVESFTNISNQYHKPCVLVDVEYVAGIVGVNLLVIQKEDAAIIADLMMGGDGSDPDSELSEMHISAVGEAMNQMMGSASTAMSSLIDDVVNISPPNAEYLEMDQALDNKKFFGPEEELVATSFDLKVGDLIDSQFQQLSTVDFTKKLVKKLTEEDDGLTLKDEIEEYETKDKDKISVAEDTKPGATIKSENKGAGYNEQKSSSQDKQKSTAKMDRTAQSGQVSQDTVDVQKASFPDFNEPASQPLPQNIELVKDVPLKATVRLGKAQMKIKDILDLGEGSIIELDKLAGETVDLLVNGKLIAKGEVVVIDENFGFRVKDIVSPKERLSSI
ncbi:flagellar motor switch phosphatase FliY [Halanaerobiaceae bacterium Z-7014]|uniref:Flagellar motor switch phosphatase FliY n=2 Tax=Halonatronomonas betaini TaxID=2778430 RepID=A0A931APZ7_9FIRM|nr:flagellar motor switch phosphatase FliY [Halonatronomonas betaini]